MHRGGGRGQRGKDSMSGGGRRSGSNYAAGNNRDQGGLFSFFREILQGGGRMTGGGQSFGGGKRGTGGMRRDGMGGMGRGIKDITGAEKTGTGENIPNKDYVSQEASQLKERARQMEEELNAIRGKINDMESNKAVSKVLVDREICTGCGRCEEACPRGAISVRETAEIDQVLCTQCGRCVDECPAGALRIL